MHVKYNGACSVLTEHWIWTTWTDTPKQVYNRELTLSMLSGQWHNKNTHSPKAIQ